MKTNKPHIVFDFDGVLCDSINQSIESYSFVRKNYFPLLPEIDNKYQYIEIFSGDPDSCLYKWLTPDQTRIFYEKQTKYSFENSYKLNMFSGTADWLLSLPISNISILTTNLKATVNELLNRELGSNFINNVSVYSKELNLSKTEMFRILFKDKNVRPIDTFYVCDSEMDIKICNELTINSIAVSYGYFPSETLRRQKPSIEVQNVSQLSLAIKHILSRD